MSGWGAYLAAWVLFVVSHRLPMTSPVKPWLVARLGASGYGLAYSALSVVMLGWLLKTAREAPFVVLYSPPDWGSWGLLGATSLALALLALTLGKPNPWSFGGWRNEMFDLDRPGLVAWIRHPILTALGLWAGGHLLVRGDLAHVSMFAGLAGFAALGCVAIDRRKRRDLGARDWHRQLSRMRAAPLRWDGQTPWRLGLAMAATLGLIGLHPWLAGPVIAPRFLP